MKSLVPLLAILVSCTASVPYPLAVQGEIAANCQASGGSQALCDCAVAELQKRLSYEEYQVADLVLRTGGAAPEKFAKALVEARAACAGR